MSEVADITPAHEPIGLAREMVERAPGCVAAVCVLVREDGSMWYDSCGHHRMEVLWALEKLRHQLMMGEKDAL